MIVKSDSIYGRSFQGGRVSDKNPAKNVEPCTGKM